MPHKPFRDVRAVMEEWLQPTEQRRQRIEEGALAMEVGVILYNLRVEAGLTQAQLAEKVGTSRTAIARLEDAEYQGHSLAMLRRVAAALGKEIVISVRDRVTEEAVGESGETRTARPLKLTVACRTGKFHRIVK